ncbi:hypothetical protein, partial [Parabacteroides sp.]
SFSFFDSFRSQPYLQKDTTIIQPLKQQIKTRITQQTACWHTVAERVMWLANSKRLYLVVDNPIRKNVAAVYNKQDFI